MGTSPKYEEHSAPRLLFVSLDPGNNDHYSEPSDRTPKAIRRFHEADIDGPCTPQWRALHLFALRLFNEIRMLLDARDALFAATGRVYRARKCENELLPVLPYIANVNSAKCSANGNGKMDKAPGGFFVKCRNHVQEELAVLEPDTIVTQGNEAAAVLAEMNPQRTPEFAVRHPNERIRIVTIKGRQVLWIQTTHPVNKSGLFWKEGCTCGSHEWCEYARAFADWSRASIPSLCL